MINIILIILMVLFLNLPMAYELIEDYYEIKKTGKDKHNKDVWTRIWAITLASCICGIIRGWGSNNVIIDILACGLFAIGCYSLFDIILNLIRGFEWDYLGTESDTDKWLSEVHPFVIYIGRIVMLFGGIVIFIWL